MDEYFKLGALSLPGEGYTRYAYEKKFGKPCPLPLEVASPASCQLTMFMVYESDRVKQKHRREYLDLYMYETAVGLMLQTTSGGRVNLPDEAREAMRLLLALIQRHDNPLIGPPQSEGMDEMRAKFEEIQERFGQGLRVEALD